MNGPASILGVMVEPVTAAQAEALFPKAKAAWGQGQPADGQVSFYVGDDGFLYRIGDWSAIYFYNGTRWDYVYRERERRA